MRKRSLNHEEVLEVEISKETLVEAELRINKSLRQFIDIETETRAPQKKSTQR
jgi:hypothetical protein